MSALNLKHLKQYRDLAWLLLKHGRGDLVKRAGLSELAANDAAAASDCAAGATTLAADLEKLGPTYVKLGQLLSTRADMLPQAYLDALSRLQDNVEPFEFDEVESIVARELGVRISKAFLEFDRKPIAAASLGQVHGARLRDGRAVVVKVQRPDIQDRIGEDLDALCELGQFLDSNTEAGRQYEIAPMMLTLRKSLLNELDYRREARNLVTLNDNLREFSRIVVPAPVEDYTTARVLTMDYIRGRKITSISPLRRMELDSGELIDQLFRAYLKQILIDGFFHADPHPGNVFLTDDANVALIDLGMVALVAPVLRDGLLKLILAVSEGRGDKTAQVAIAMGNRRDDYDEAQFFRRISDLVAENFDLSLGQANVGRSTLEIKRIAAECGVSLPPEITMVGKALLNLDEIARTLAPSFDPTRAIRDNTVAIMQHKFRASLSPGRLFTSVLEAKETLEELPRRLNMILDRVANNDIRIKVDALEEETLIQGMQKIANRITTGLILAALIIGASMLMQVETSFRLMGYPGFAIICFSLAAGGGLVLIASIVANDMRSRRRK
ncbi:MAG: AarF/UbiB family protein [Pseudomonadota bacterium]|nr:AarF/UbiB family protein [Pseudomonadota bacterium]